jgi:hypothetical protein
VIHYHGLPITPDSVAIELLAARHACVSFAHPEQVAIAAEVCQSFILDNGAFSFWRSGNGCVDVVAYAAWVARWHRHPAFDWCLIPDIIDGTEQENDEMLRVWNDEAGRIGINPTRSVPVWHLHESVERLERLVVSGDRVALGSSGEFADIGTLVWWERMDEAMRVCCDPDGRPRVRLHGLRMLNPTVFSQLPLASADSTNVARNIGMDARWDRAPYAPRSKSVRALIIADRIEHHCSANRWNGESRGIETNGELFG